MEGLLTSESFDVLRLSHPLRLLKRLLRNEPEDELLHVGEWVDNIFRNHRHSFPDGVRCCVNCGGAVHECGEIAVFTRTRYVVSFIYLLKPTQSLLL